jgi:MFS family permease
MAEAEKAGGRLDKAPAVGGEGWVATLGAIVAGALILQVANTIMNTVVPLRLAFDQRSPLLIGLVGSAYWVGFLFGCFTIPTLIRRIGHIRGFAVFAAVQATLTLTFPLTAADWWGLSRLVMGTAAAGHSICIESWISGQARSSHRGRLFGIYQILNRLALISSQLAMGYVAIQAQDIFLAASAAFSIALIPVGLTRARGPESGALVSVRLNTLWLQAPAAVVGCLYAGLMSGPLTNVVPAYGILIGMNQKAAILLTAAVQVGVLLLQWPVGLLADRVDSRLVMLFATSATVLAVAGLGGPLIYGSVPRDVWLYGTFALIGGSSVTLYTVAVTHAYARLGREQALGLSAGLLFLWGVGATLGPLAATVFMQTLGPHGLLLYLGALSVAVGAYFAFRRIIKPPAAAVERPFVTAPAPAPGLSRPQESRS